MADSEELPEGSQEENVEVFPGVLETFSEEQFAKVKEVTSKLLKQDSGVNLAAAVMLNSQRMYALARLALQKELAAEGYQWSDGVEEFVIQAMKHRATQPYQRNQVLEAVTNVCLPFLAEDVEKELQDQRYVELKQLNDKEPIHIGDHVIGCDYPQLYRGNVVLYYATGHCCERVTSSLMRELAPLVLAEDEEETESKRKQCVLYFSGLTLGKFVTDRKQRPRMMRVGINNWHGLGMRRAEFEKFLHNRKEQMHAKRIDVLIVDHVPSLMNPSLVATAADHAEVEAAIEAALKLLARWSYANKTAVVVTLDENQLPCLPRFRLSKRLESLLTSNSNYTLIHGEQYT